jgi:cytosine deaminase
MADLLENAENYMAIALEEARAAASEGGIPIGAVLVKDGKVLGRGRNRRVQQNDPTAHAEIECLRNAGRLTSYSNATLYITTMPCLMSAGAIVQSGIEYVVVGERRNYSGARRFLQDHWIQIDRIDDPACVSLLAEYIEAHGDIWRENIGEA